MFQIVIIIFFIFFSRDSSGLFVIFVSDLELFSTVNMTSKGRVLEYFAFTLPFSNVLHTGRLQEHVYKIVDEFLILRK